MTKRTPTFSFQILANVFKVQVKNLRWNLFESQVGSAASICRLDLRRSHQLCHFDPIFLISKSQLLIDYPKFFFIVQFNLFRVLFKTFKNEMAKYWPSNKWIENSAGLPQDVVFGNLEGIPDFIWY
jgi:hypothetical protein